MFSDTPKWPTSNKMVKIGEVTKWCVRKHFYYFYFYNLVFSSGFLWPNQARLPLSVLWFSSYIHNLRIPHKPQAYSLSTRPCCKIKIPFIHFPIPLHSISFLSLPSFLYSHESNPIPSYSHLTPYLHKSFPLSFSQPSSNHPP